MGQHNNNMTEEQLHLALSITMPSKCTMLYGNSGKVSNRNTNKKDVEKVVQASSI